MDFNKRKPHPAASVPLIRIHVIMTFAIATHAAFRRTVVWPAACGWRMCRMWPLCRRAARLP